MRSREEFLQVREQADSRFSLKTRLTIFVALEMIICILIGFGLDYLIEWLFKDRWSPPLMLELVLVSLFIGSLITSILSRHFFGPVKHLRNAMNKVADGDFSTRLHQKTTSKEIRELYTGFNLMVSGLSSTEILQTDFVSSVSHEFKTPINAIEGYATLLQSAENLDQTQKEYVEKIIYNSGRLSYLASSILLLSKIENQAIPTNQLYYDLDEQIRQSILTLEPLWAQKDIEFDVELEDTTYCGNEMLMHHVWENLLSNAIKFDPPGGLIRMRLKNGQSRICFTIEDSGPGIPEEAQQRIFEKFYQVDHSREGEGHGLGLALVKRILTLEDGSISVENIPSGGCRFTVELKHKHP